jgi:methionyl-tRNA formyltransferase
LVEPAPLSAVFIGQGTLLVRCAEEFLRAGHRVVAVVSAESLIEQWAEAQAVPHLDPEDGLAERLGALDFDYLFSVANMRVVPADVLARPRRGAINFHDALLPRYAGAHATSWAIMGGETVHGVTWHEMLERVDAGRILKQRSVEIAPDETAISLNAKCYEAGIVSFVEVIADLAAGTATYADPRLAERTYFALHKRPAGAGVLDWQRPAGELSAVARALDFGPLPNPLGRPKIDLGDTVLLVPAVEVLPQPSTALPGTVLRLEGGSLVVATATADVRLAEVQTVEGRSLAAVDLAGLGVRAGVRLVPGTPAGGMVASAGAGYAA